MVAEQTEKEAAQKCASQHNEIYDLEV